MSHHITPDPFLVYLITHPLLRPSPQFNTNSTSASMLRISYLFLRSNPGVPIQNITPRTHPSRFHGIWWLFLRYCIYLVQTQRREHFCPSMPIGIYWIHIPLILVSECKQGSQHDSISFRVPHWFHSSCWPPWSWSSTLNTGLSDYCWLYQLAGNLHST